ncbi:MAG: maleylacetate reductase [Alphaproteobacteria bacterium]|nr:maleylacetate reductase [Alphaproteobacteria bacterium]HPF47221.1 maleylacetate reductase [Emcibacteraceae bacterium]HRW29686.1 maleylacetate reductase [Emcibacteraceae bacterium]
MQFEYTPIPTKAVFAENAALKLKDEVEKLGCRRVMIACSAGMVKRIDHIIESLGPLCVALYNGAKPHCPEQVAMEALELYNKKNADCIVAIGGGSTIGIGKAIALRTDAKFIVIATTPCGSESTPIYGMLIGNQKKTGRDVRVIARTTIYDPMLTTGLNAHLTGTIGMNSLAHCVEALYAKDKNPVSDLYAIEGIVALTKGIKGSILNPNDLNARAQVLYGGMLSGYCVNLAGIAIHHKICHVLGGHHGIPHGESNSVILPYAIAYNETAAPFAMEKITTAMKTKSASGGVYDFARDINVPKSLKELGMREEHLDIAAKETVETTPFNPKPVDFQSVRALLQQAYEGIRPIPY